MSDYTILIKAIIDKANLQAQIDQIASSAKPLTIKINPVDQAGATASVSAIDTKLSQSAAKNSNKINPIDQIDAEMALSAIDAKIAQIKAANANTAVTSSVGGINTQGEAIGNVSATLQYKNAVGEVITEIYKWDQENEALVQSTSRVRDAEIQLTNQMNAYIAAADKAMASTEGKNQSDPTVVRLKADAQALKETAQENIGVMQNGGQVTAEMQTQVRGLSNSMNDSSMAFKAANNNVKSFGDMIQNDIAKVAQWGISTAIIYGTLKDIQGGIQYIKDLNVAMTEIQMVTGATSEEISKLADDYNKLATELSSTTLAVATGALEWERAGYSAADSMKLLQASTLQATLGNMNAADSTDKLIATLHGFGLEASDAMNIVSKLVALDNSYASSVGKRKLPKHMATYGYYLCSL
jgi:hypothetical protein